jgi:hypothetical protein
LLERKPEPIGELRLAHSEYHPTHPDPAAYVFVDRVGGFSDGCLFHISSEILMRGRTAQAAPAWDHLLVGRWKNGGILDRGALRN